MHFSDALLFCPGQVMVSVNERTDTASEARVARLIAKDSLDDRRIWLFFDQPWAVAINWR